MTHKENLLKAVRFERPERIPISFGIGAACWNHYDQAALRDLMCAHPLLFPGADRIALPVEPRYQPWRVAGSPYTDSWGCVWETNRDGMTGAVVEHALPDWDAFEEYRPPDPDRQDGWTEIDWDRIAERFSKAEAQGQLRRGGLRHGHTFLTLTYIRGYENLLYDMADDEPRLWELIDRVEQFNLGLVRRYLDRGAEWMGYPEDLGMQRGPMLSPDQFRKWIKPTYRRLIAPARDAGCVIHMHSDGDVRDLAEDLLDCGVQVLNLQDLVNGVDWIRENLKGRVCIDLDLDRQRITRFGTPEQIDAHVRNAVERLGAPAGGLLLKHGLYPGIPLANVAALMDAMERYSRWFS